VIALGRGAQMRPLWQFGHLMNLSLTFKVHHVTARSSEFCPGFKRARSHSQAKRAIGAGPGIA
jgi:hypothetical protein